MSMLESAFASPTEEKIIQGQGFKKEQLEESTSIQ
jgi:hypothetical protein